MMRRKNRDMQHPSALNERKMLCDRLSFAGAEAYKLLRANLLLSIPDEKKCRVVGVTSSLHGEGKSTTSINLAYTLAETGKRVLLMELDMRLPNIARRLGLTATPGLSNYLAGLSTEEEVLQQSYLQEHFYVIPSGDIPPNPSELLGSERMERLLESLKRQFDFIVFDLPPVTVVADALVVSKLTNGMIVVVRQNYSNQRALAETMRQLRFLEIKLLGFVMTQADGQEKSYRSSGKYGYGYGNGGYGQKKTSAARSHSQTGRTKKDD